MTTINLYQNKEEKKSVPEITANAGFIFSLSILIMSLVLLAGVRLYSVAQAKQSAASAEAVRAESDSLVGLDNLKRIFDIQTRLAQIKLNLQIRDNKVNRIQMTRVLDHFGSDINTGAVVRNYKYESDGKITVSFSVNNFADAARQIATLKKSAYFTNVNLTSIARGEKNILCDITMNIKK